MLEQNSGLGKLAPWKTRKTESYVRTLSLKVPHEASGRLGDVQGLIGTVADAKTGNILSANIEEAFADGLDDALKTLPVTATLETTFETVMARVNLMLQRLLGERGLPIGDVDVRGAIIAQRGRDVAAAVWGKPSLILFRRGIEGGPKLFDVLQAENESSAAADTKAGFNNLISGKISGKDRMVVSNRDLIKLLDRHCLQEILSAPRTDTVTMLLRDALVARHENLDLAMLLLDGFSGAETAAAPASEAVDKSVREKQVEATMNNDGPNEIVPQLTEQGNTGLTVAQHTGTMKKVLDGTKDTFGKFSKTVQKSAKQAGKAVASAGQTIGNKALNAMTVEEKPQEEAVKDGGKEARSEGGKEIKEKKKEQKQKVHPIDAVIIRWNGLADRSRKLFIFVLVLVFALNVSLSTLGWQRNQAQAAADYEKTISTIRQQLDSAEASMIYRDEERARRLLGEAAAALALLPGESDEEALLKAQLGQELEAKFTGLRHAVALEAPEVLSTVMTQSGAPDLRGLTAVGGALWAAAADGTVFKISPEDGSAEAIYAPENGVVPEIFLTHKNGLITGTQDNLTFISTAGQAAPQTINAGDYELSVDDATTFGSRMYLLDSAHNRIVKFAGVPGGYSSPAVYTKDGTDLSNAISLTIDGSVFVLTGSGQVIKMLSGKSEDFSVGTTDPALTSPDLLHTPDEDSDLYVLDTSRTRVVRFNKGSGAVMMQYESEELRGVTDIQIDEAARSILATKGNRLLRFTWPEEE